ncbi:MarR family winged helix-turn-helix transcriptional regulator [Nocardia sp. BMG51109]|uniref:MarR family winged helix-turn-helix transcriptional regulator n=1 Tax=Nocardia sp. BMG51109 TaxID=1056816 RepID=UPI000465B136|nr:MarR family transcriptional regulator [Nocardia sp. BMG51109]
MAYPSDVPPPSIGFLVWHLSMKWRARMDRALAPLDLTATHYALLASLYGLTRGGRQPSQRELADSSSLEPMYVSKLVRLLEKRGLVKRSTNPADTRAVALTITDRGAEVVSAARAITQDLQTEHLLPLGGVDSERSLRLQEELRILLRHTIGDAAAAQPPEGP